MNLVTVKDLKTNKDDRGYLYEVLREDWFDGVDIKQVYVVEDQARETIRGFHKHDELVDYFCIISGSAKFIFEKDGEMETVVLSEKNPQVIEVPTDVYHGWKSLEDNTKLLSIATELYNYDNPDEERIPYNTYGKDVWEQVIK